MSGNRRRSRRLQSRARELAQRDGISYQEAVRRLRQQQPGATIHLDPRDPSLCGSPAALIAGGMGSGRSARWECVFGEEVFWPADGSGPVVTFAAGIDGATPLTWAPQRPPQTHGVVIAGGDMTQRTRLAMVLAAAAAGRYPLRVFAGAATHEQWWVWAERCAGTVAVDNGAWPAPSQPDDYKPVVRALREQERAASPARRMAASATPAGTGRRSGPAGLPPAAQRILAEGAPFVGAGTFEVVSRSAVASGDAVTEGFAFASLRRAVAEYSAAHHDHRGAPIQVMVVDAAAGSVVEQLVAAIPDTPVDRTDAVVITCSSATVPPALGRTMSVITITGADSSDPDTVGLTYATPGADDVARGTRVLPPIRYGHVVVDEPGRGFRTPPDWPHPWLRLASRDAG